MKENLKNKRYKLLTFLSLLVIGLTVVVYIVMRLIPPDRIPPAGPTIEEQKQIAEYYNKCPLDKLAMETFSDESEDFYLGRVLCSANEHPDFRTSEPGEEATVEIYTPDENVGIREFRDWLAGHGLTESSNLRIDYIHKPKP